MATIKEIAKKVNVSMATVSRVLNHDEALAVSDELRNKIFQVAHELSYVPPKMRRMPLEDGIVIGVADWHIIRRDRTNYKISDFSNIAKRFCCSPVTFKRMFFGESVKVDGIIALGSFTDSEMDFLKSQSYSLVFVNSNKNDYSYDRIMIDHDVGINQMVAYCIEQQYQSIGFISGYYESENIVISKTRNNTFKRILSEYHCYDERYCSVGDMTAESGYNLAMQHIRENRMPRAVLCGNDEIAEGVLTAISERGLLVPRDVDVIIYKDIETLLSKFPGYTSVQMYTEFMWETTIQLILERVSGKRSEVMTLVFPSKFTLLKGQSHKNEVSKHTAFKQ